MKFLFWAIALPAVCITAITYVVINIPCDGLACAGNGILMLGGFGAVLIGSLIAGIKFSSSHRAVYATLFPAITTLLIFTSVWVSSMLVENVYKMNLANDREAATFGIPSLALYTEPVDVAIPISLSDNYWQPIQHACTQAGYDISKYEGETVTSLRYSIWSQSWNGLGVGAVALNRHYDVVCLYKEVLQKEDTEPVPLPSPNVFAINEESGFIIRK